MNTDKTFQSIKSNLEILGAIMALEYHNKNHLSGDDESRCMDQRLIVEHTKRLILSLEDSMKVKPGGKAEIKLTEDELKVIHNQGNP